MRDYQSEIPWEDSTKWKVGFWYPLPIGFHRRAFKGWIHDSWGIFMLEIGETNGDIDPVISGELTLTQALGICEEHNQEELLE